MQVLSLRGGRTLLAALVAVVGVGAVAGTALATGAAGVNGTSRSLDANAALSSSGPVGCAILDPNFNPVTSVAIAHSGSQADWLDYTSGGDVATKVTFSVKPVSNAADPLRSETQVFGFPSPGSSTSILTPFGITYWGSNLTSGTYQLRVSNNLGHFATCNFTAS